MTIKIESKNNFRKGKIFLEDLKIVMNRYVTNKITEKDINLFEVFSGDYNSIRLNNAFASHTIFKKKLPTEC